MHIAHSNLQGGYQYAQPFAGPGLAEVVKATFFGNTLPYKVGTQNIGLLVLSLPTAPHELEIPDAMLAMAAAAVSSIFAGLLTCNMSTLINTRRSIRSSSIKFIRR